MPPEGSAEVWPFWDPIGGASLAPSDWALFVSLLDASAFGFFLPQAFPLLAFLASVWSLLIVGTSASVFPLLAFSASGASLSWKLLLCFEGGFA